MFLSHISSFGRFDSTLSSFKLHLRLLTVNPPAEKNTDLEDIVSVLMSDNKIINVKQK